MAKGTPIQKLVNGEIADANDVNQIVEDAGTEGGLIPYLSSTHENDTTGGQSIGSAAFPFGSLIINENAQLVEVSITNHQAVSSIQWNNLRRFIFLKDTPTSYLGNTGKFLRCNTTEDGIEFANPVTSQLFTSSGTFVVPAGITKIYVSLVGGGGGGGAQNTGVNSKGGGGGGGGAAIIHYVYTVTPGGSYTVTVGAAGVGGASNGANGTDGTSSIFDVGGGNLTAEGGTHGQAGGTAGAGGPGGYNASSGSGGTAKLAGGNGAANNGQNGGGGGGSPFGAGGDGGGSSVDGNPGNGFGAGGGGGFQATGKKGGAGAGGMVLISY